MIQDIKPHKLNNQYDTEAVPQLNDRVIHFHDRKVTIVRKVNGFDLTRVSDWAEGTRLVYLFQLDEHRIWLTRDEDVALPEFCEEAEPRMLKSEFGGPKEMIFAVMTAFQLYNWYRNNQFCGRCGHKTELSQIERAIVCPECGNTIYPKIVPAVIVAVTDGDKILLTKYANRTYSRYALIAGFTEIGETLEETVAREVMEEVGLRVKNIRYYKSQPWGIVDDLLAGFICEVDGSREVKLDRDELKEGTWLSREEIPVKFDDNSMTNEMITLFKEGKL